MAFATGASGVTKSDSADLPSPSTGGLYIGGAGSGNLTVTMLDGSRVAFAGLTAGTLLPIVVTRVWSTGTDVTSVVALRNPTS